MLRYWKRYIFSAAGFAVLAYAGVCTYFWANQVELIFLPLQPIKTTPDDFGMEYEDITIPVGSGSELGKLHGFWVKSPDPEAPTFLYLHGQDATIGNYVEDVKHLHQLGYHVLLIDYRGFGRSYGTTEPSESKVYEDAQAAWNYLMGKGVSSSRIFIYGHSLGGAIAIELATHHPEAAGLITECTFTCARDIGALQYNGCLGLLPLDSILNQRFESLERTRKLQLPVLLIHGTEDPRIPCHMTEELYAVAPKAKELLLIEGGGHSVGGSPEYMRKVSAFVEKNVSPTKH